MYKNNFYLSFLKISKIYCSIILVLSSLCCSKSQARTGHETRSSTINKEITNEKTFEIGSYIDVCDCSNQNGRCNRELAKYLLTDKGIPISEKIFPSEHYDKCFSDFLTAAFQFLGFFPRIVEFIQNNKTHCLNFNQLIEDILNTDLSIENRKTQLNRFIKLFYADKNRYTNNFSVFDALPMNFSNIVAFLSGKHFTIDACKNSFTRTATINDFFRFECEVVCYNGEKQFSIYQHFGFSYDLQIKNLTSKLLLSENNDFLQEILFPSNRISKHEIRFVHHPTYLMFKWDSEINDFLISCYDEDQNFYCCKFYRVKYKIIGFFSYVMDVDRFALVFFHEDNIAFYFCNQKRTYSYTIFEKFYAITGIKNAFFLLEKA